MDWLPKYDNPLDFLGTFLLIFGVFLVLSGFGVITVEKISVKRGVKTWILGILVSIIGTAFLWPRINTSQPSALTPESPSPAATLPPATLPPPATTAPATLDVQTPEGFLRYYFSLVTNGKDYNLAWSLLTPQFQEANNPGGKGEYVDYWKTIRQVDVNKVEIDPLSNTSVECRVDLTFHTISGMAVDRTLDYHLIYDMGKKTWMFDSP